MALPENCSVNDLKDLFGFNSNRLRAGSLTGFADQSSNTEPDFIPHRVFINQVDTFNVKYISSYLVDQSYGSSKQAGDEEAEDEFAEEDVNEEALVPSVVDLKQTVKYEIIGTLYKQFHKKTEDILFTIKEDAENFIDNILKCGVIIYDITKNPDEIPKALATLSIIEAEIENLKELAPKAFKTLDKLRIFILISTTMTWARTKPIDPEEPDLPFTETDYKKRKPHPNYKEHIECEKEVVMKGRKFKDKLKTYVIASGIVYGAEEDDLTFLFKLAWNNEPELPNFLKGKNSIPLIHIKDLAKVVHELMNNTPRMQYILAIEQTPSKLKQIVKALSKTMGSGKIKDVAAEEAFLYKEMTQTLFERLTVNLIMEPGLIVEDLAIEWQNESSLVENIQAIVNEFKTTRRLTPIRVILHGPPAIGKTRIANKLAKYYGAHYISVKEIIEYTITNLKSSIEKLNIKANEEKPVEEELGEEEEEEEEEAEEEITIEDLEEQLKEIEDAISDSGNGRLSDDQVIGLIKSFLSGNRCQNQGYIIDGYPKTIEQTKALFGEENDEGEEEAAEEGTESGVKSKLLPDYVISLEATDQFLCDRIMSLPEREIQGTHYTEENMLRRLTEFRTNNNEDNTLLNFFDEMEIHPIVIDAMCDNTENMEMIMEKLISRLGKPVGFAMSPEEEELFMYLENEKENALQRQAEIEKENLERQALDDYQTKMEQWTALLEELQNEEEKILVAQGEPLRNYLMKFVFPILSGGLLKVATLKPEDPVDFLAEYLFKENPEGHMFDPAYTRDGENMIKKYQETEINK